MRTGALLLSFAIAAGPAFGQTQPPPSTPAAQTPPKPAAPTTAKPPAPRTTKPAAGRSGIALVVTDRSGATLADVQVDVDGPTPRSEKTNASGLVNFSGLQPGTYRLRFSGEQVTTFEREVATRAGQTTTLDIALSPAPPPREVVKVQEAPEPAAPPAGPKGEPRVLSLVDLVEKEYERKQPRRESVVSCSGNTRSTLLQLNQDQPERLYDSADSLFYVIAGEGFIRMDGRETRLEAGGFASVPRETSFTLGRRGRNPLVLLAVLSGAPCEEPR